MIKPGSAPTRGFLDVVVLEKTLGRRVRFARQVRVALGDTDPAPSGDTSRDLKVPAQVGRIKPAR